MKRKSYLQCMECNHIFVDTDVKWKPLGNNFNVMPNPFMPMTVMDWGNAQGVPACPKCGKAHFFGFNTPNDSDIKTMPEVLKKVAHMAHSAVTEGP